MEISEIMERLFGNIAPVGETYEDQRRLENVDKFETALNYIIKELLNSYDYIGSIRISEYKIAEKAKDILIDLKNKLVDILVVDLDFYNKSFTREQIEDAINSSVSDYDCLVEKLNEMMYPEEFEKMKNESEVE